MAKRDLIVIGAPAGAAEARQRAALPRKVLEKGRLDAELEAPGRSERAGIEEA